MTRYDKYLGTFFRKGGRYQASKLRGLITKTGNFLRPATKYKGDATFRKFNMLDGTQISVWYINWGLAPTIMTYVAPSIVLTQVEEGELFSGLFSIEDFYPGGTLGSGVEIADYTFVFADSGGWAHTTPAPSSLMSAQYETYSSGLLIPYPKSAPAKHSKSFSGTMAKVVQLLAGMNYEIEFEYKWSKTHGIFVNQTTGQPFVIEISASGVFSWPLEATSGTFEDLPFTIDIKKHNIPATKTELASAATVAACYAGSPFSPEIGWAFSEDGSEAQNVVEKSGYYSAYGSDTYNKSFRYKITISADGNGDPLSASVAEVDSGWCWSNRLQNYLRVPVFTESCGIRNERIFWYSFGQTSPAASYSFPVHVFYKGNTAVVINYDYEENDTTSIPDSAKPSGVLDYYDVLQWPNTESAYTGYWTGRSVTTGGGNFDVPEAARSQTLEIMESSLTAEYRLTALGGAILGRSSSNFTTDIFSAGYLGEKFLRLNHTQSTLLFSCLGLPHFNREAYYYIEKEIVEGEAETETRYTDNILGGGSRHNSSPSAFWLKSTPSCAASEQFYKSVPGGTGTTDPSPPASMSGGITAVFSATFNNIWFAGSGPTSCTNAANTTTYFGYTSPSGYALPYTRTINSNIGTDPEYNSDITASYIYSAGSSLLSESLNAAYNDDWFIGDLSGDQADCPSASSPVWFGAVQDAFTLKGWASAGLSTETDGSGEIIIIGGPLTGYDVESLSSGRRFSGWFGIPFPA